MKSNLTSIHGSDGTPPEPFWSETYADEVEAAFARDQWGVIVRDLRDSKTLTAVNGHAIKRLIGFQVEYERAARHVGENGAILPAVRAKIGQFNPYWAVMKHADEAIRVLEGVLGLLPTTRNKAKAVKSVEKTERPSDRYIKKSA